MGLRTYLPFLRVLALGFCRYIERNHDRIVESIGEDNVAVLDAAHVACAALEVVLNNLIPKPT